MAHKRHTKSHRLAFGEVATKEQIQALARTYFLIALDEVVPECRAELAALFEKHQDHIDDAGELLERLHVRDDVIAEGGPPWLPLVAAVKAWAVRYCLTNPREPAPWVLETAAVTMAQWGHSKLREWVYPGAGSALIGREERAIAGGRYTYDPQSDLASTLNRGRSARVHLDVAALTSLAIKRGGTNENLWVQESEHWAWVAAHQVGRESYERIAGRCHRTPGSIRVEVEPLKALIDLSLPKGRPPKTLRS